MDFDFKSVSKEWIDLGIVDDKICFFEDPIIPERYIKGMQHGFFLKLNGQIYHFKTLNRKKYFTHELLGESVTEFMGLTSIHQELAKCRVHGKEVYGLLSILARQENMIYQSLEDFSFEEKVQNPFIILKTIDSFFIDEPICEDFRDFFVRDYFTQEKDRASNEILVSTSTITNEKRLGYLSDYEFEFCETLKLSNFKTFQFDLEEKEICESIYRDEKLLSSFRKILQIQLVGLLKKLAEKKNLLVTEEEIEYFQNYESEMKRKISKSLGV